MSSSNSANSASSANSTAAFAYGGCVIDERGTPVADAEVTATHQRRDGRGFGYIDTVKSDDRGHFAISRSRARSGAYPTGVVGDIIRLEFSHPDHQYVKLEDLHAFSPAQATALTVTLREGRSLTGQVIDPAGRPVAGASVEITFGKLYELRRGLTTDAEGRFTFRGLPQPLAEIHVHPEAVGEIRVLTTDLTQPAMTATRTLGATETNAGTLTLTPIDLPPAATVHELFGMKLIDIDASLQAAFHLSDTDGVLVLDPGEQRLGLELQRGDQFWMVGDARIANFAEFAQQLLTLSAHGRVRVVYSFRRPDFAGTNTQHLALSTADIAELSVITGA